MKFSAYSIHPEIKDNLVRLGYKKPTDIQYKAIPSILDGEDVLAIAQTGTGKTAAFAIPVLHLIHRRKTSKRTEGVRCLVMVPTHELALQIRDVFHELGRGLKVKTTAIFGGVDQLPQIQQLNNGVDVLIATPGRMFDLHAQGHLSLDQLECLILDEADHMLDLGFIKDIRDLIKRLPQRRQTLFFSATINPGIKKLAYSLVRNPIRIQLSPKNPVNKNIDHQRVGVAMEDKRFFLERLLNEHPEKKFLVFVRTRVRAERVVKAMERVGIVAEALHSDKEQSERLSVMDRFRNGEIRLLIATDVSARGIDIPDVEYVVNYDLPDQPETYVHRVGRTGRGRNRGQAVAFVAPGEQEKLDAIEEYLGHSIVEARMDGQEYETTVDLSLDTGHDWRSLIEEAQSAPQKKKKKKRKKR